jgi:glycosyltransferase involved in cell wall biosynthesis
LPALECGGVERGVVELAKAVAAAGHRSLVISAGGQLVEELRDHGCQHITCPLNKKSPWTFSWVPWLRKLLLRERVNLIDYHSRLPGWITYLAWSSLPPAVRPRLISTLNGLHSVNWYSGVMCRGERVIVVSQTVRDYVLKNYPTVPVENLRLVPRGIDAAEFPRGFQPSPAWKSAFFRDFPRLAEKPLVTLIGRLTRLKGHHDFIAAMEAMKSANVPAHGLIVGGCEPRKAAYFSELRELVSRKQLEGHLTFAGPRDDVKEICAISRVVVSASTKPESFGLTVAEALSVGTPVVAYDHGGVAEILAAQFPRGAVPLGNVSLLAERIGEFVCEPPHQEIRENPFTRKAMLTGTLAVYQELLDVRARQVA